MDAMKENYLKAPTAAKYPLCDFDLISWVTTWWKKILTQNWE